MTSEEEGTGKRAQWQRTEGVTDGVCHNSSSHPVARLGLGLDLLPSRFHARKSPGNTWSVLLHNGFYYAFQKLAARSYKPLASL